MLMRKRYIFPPVVLFFFFFITALAHGQVGDTVCEPYKPLVVQITVKFSDGSQNYGFGFIVGEQDTGSQGRYFYIVTANHVVRQNRPESERAQIQLRFFWDAGGVVEGATLLDVSDKIFDLALLRIAKSKVFGANSIVWNNQAWCRQWQRGEKVWFIGQAAQWYVPLDTQAGTMLLDKADLHGFVQIDIHSIQPGTSGAPLLTKNGIVGMVVSDSGSKARAVNIDIIRRFVAEMHRYPWGLIEYGEKMPQIMTDPTTGMELVWIPKGCFQMGSPESEKDRDAADEGPVHQVCVDGFWLGKYEVTQGQWKKIMGQNPASFTTGDNYPVEKVSWEDIQFFLDKLNKQSGKGYRLPYEAEWEYAARAGTSTARYWGDEISCDKAMYENDLGSSEDSCVAYVRKRGLTPDSTAPVGSYASNPFGLYDMLGNVWEWCGDWYSKDYYSSRSRDNPHGPVTGSSRVIRGGSWYFSPWSVRSASRYGDTPDSRYGYLGFRLALPGQ
ncbi:MAG: sulfatase-modifying factor protein [Candidatus Electrothrix sp. AR3]|nr:sulfatase-modifying factor protein [Candidatus Electrothrix sp. AR3]